MTVAMTCNNLGADVMDSTSKDILTDQSINMEETWFEMSPKQREHFDQVSSYYETIRNQHHAIHSTLWFNEKNFKFIERFQIQFVSHIFFINVILIEYLFKGKYNQLILMMLVVYMEHLSLIKWLEFFT